MASGNPALNEKTFSNVSATTGPVITEAMTLEGTALKAGFLSLLVVGGAAYTWNLYFTTQSISAITPWIWIGSIAGFIVAMITVFKKNFSPITAPIYAVLEGLLLGGISATVEAQYPGIAIQAISLTFAILAAMLLIYVTKLIKPSENFKLGVAAATGGICIYYLVAMVLSFFHIKAPMIWDSGPIGIGFSVFVIIIASLNLVVDFDFIEQGVQVRCPKYMEWYSAFGLMVTLVWLYIEVLNLLSKSRRR